MRRYIVSWRPEVQSDLADIWTNATNRPAIAAAADRIDDLLSQDPANQGEDVHEGLRGVTVEPLLVYFTVSESDRLVTVWAVRPTTA